MAREIKRRPRPWTSDSPEPDWEMILSRPQPDPRDHRFARELGPDFEAMVCKEREAWFRADFRRRGVRAGDWEAYATKLSRVYRTKIEPLGDFGYELACYYFAAVYLSLIHI